MNTLFLRALGAFLVLPGMAAGVVPWVIRHLAPGPMHGTGVGVVIAALGGVVLLACVRDFYVAGRGTLAPWDPPRNLVVVGLYRFTRNPMYWGVLFLVLGQSLLAGSPVLFGYAVALALAFHLRVVWNEEPFLAATFGDDWVRYRDALPRWGWSARPFTPDHPGSSPGD